MKKKQENEQEWAKMDKETSICVDFPISGNAHPENSREIVQSESKWCGVPRFGGSQASIPPRPAGGGEETMTRRRGRTRCE